MYRLIRDIVAGKGAPGDIDKLVDVAGKIEGHTICGLGEAAAWPVQSYVAKFRPEFEAYIKTGKGKK
jgi:NADH-quinone oxidoreductase subunit F